MIKKTNTQSIMQIVSFIVLIFFISLISLTVGLISGAQQGHLFLLMRDFKRIVIPQPSPSETREPWRFNEYEQLTWYHKKTEVTNPIISNNTLVAFVFGQSNAANSGGERYISKDKNVLNYFGGKFYVAADPLLGATGFSGSVWTNLGNKIVDNKLSNNVILIPAGVGGSSIKDWQDGGRLNKMFKERLQDAREKNLNINYFFWHQGESDNALPPNQYLDGLNNIIDLTKLYFPKSKFYVAQTSRCGISPSSNEILDAQLKATLRHDVFLGPNTDKIDLNDRYDDCHFSGRGLEIHAEGWLNSLKNLGK